MNHTSKNQAFDVATVLAQLQQPFTGEALFDFLQDVVFFFKDTSGRYVVVNQTLVERCGLQNKQQLIGFTASEVFGLPMGQGYEDQDYSVVKSGQPITRQLELHVYPSRKIGWCLTSKLPLFNNQGHIIGLTGISQDLLLPDITSAEYNQIVSAVNYAQSHIAEAPTASTLASAAAMSLYRLDRRMQRVFGLTTGQWLLKLRLDTARQQLLNTDLPIAEIALNVGYSDQGAFTRQFRRTTGLTPSQFRLLNSLQT